ncbi:Formate dehydrogenase, subunit FdhD [Thiomonas arsenitoxydans]|jgi:FdhD protein|uniref:Sulfur carrier protein FdhD n=2 Tax=Burkholderiales genera incertae sedis TaxID=224471 RepID=D6CKF8_THIA3|nr:formate dehydrogenase accessory sulfurtransferase FdhD [Thiomonas arsenitoxydans]OZB69383.1 MAG: sulfurtransferase FdhD [Thiomonas sp. 13-64-67]CAZ86772.1 formate dehydrogenase, subunit FdhD [Thiomonas arsenitoxydans]CQR28367.1 Formate dehydrogenase, subunit FdhD [Thiomonas arsenitoxydans]CQR28373.1 Formate dehydrogenase, subunit FdhD [Thiomonas arsenitoxydans]CQR28529.1 Formate dehydrogenase, subunit FdhD [Thiomonas arsenitoxydans]
MGLNMGDLPALETVAPTAFEAVALPRRPDAPRLSRARCEVVRPIGILDQHGEHRQIDIPTERPLTIYLDKRELVTLMTLGANPELLVLGYLLNQGLVEQAGEIDGIDVDWAVEAAAVRTRHGVSDLEARVARRVVTTGCGQGTVFGDAMAQLGQTRLPDAQAARLRQATLISLLDQMKLRDSVHRQAGSVHGCALFHGDALQCFVEDVGRHNAIDTVAGWMAVHGVQGGDKVFYTTGRLTSEMVIKSARMGVPIIVSRNGVTAMGHQLAETLGMTLFGRAAGRHFLCYTGFERFDAEAPPSTAPLAFADTVHEKTQGRPKFS